MFFDHYPYTNFHNINLDWVLQAVKAWGQTVEANDRAFRDLKEANEDFKRYVTNYLQDLDIADEINTKLDNMLASGILTPYFAPYVKGYVDNWLASHVTPTSPALDSTLTLSGAAARADSTGKRLKDLAYVDALSTPEVVAALNRSQVLPGYRVQGIAYDYNGHYYVCGGSVDETGTGVIVKMTKPDFTDAEITEIPQLGHANDIAYYNGYLYVCTVGGGDAPRWGIYKINVNDFTDKTLISNAPENTIGISYRQGDFWLLAPYRIYRTTDFTSYEVVVGNTNDLLTAYGIPTEGRISQTLFRAAGYLIGWVCSFVFEDRHYGALTFFNSAGEPIAFKMFPAYHSEIQGAVYADMSIYLLADGNMVNVFRMDPRHLSYVQLKAGDDLNSFTGRGTLYSTGSNVSAALLNSPSAGEGFTVQVDRLGVYNTIQTARTNSGRELYRIKSFNNDTWGEWIEPAAEVAEIKEDLYDIKTLDRTALSYTLTAGKYIKYLDGTTASTSAGSITNYIDISGYNAISYKRRQTNAASSSSGMAFYDANKSYISGEAALGGQSTTEYVSGLHTIDVPEGAVYARFTAFTDTETYGEFVAYGETALYAFHNEALAGIESLKTVSTEVTEETENVYDGALYGSYLTINASTGALSINSHFRTLMMACEPNTFYTVKKTAGLVFCVGTYDSTPRGGLSCLQFVVDNTADEITITTHTDALYLAVTYWRDTDTIELADMVKSIVINKGESAVDKVLRDTLRVKPWRFTGAPIPEGLYECHTVEAFDGTGESGLNNETITVSDVYALYDALVTAYPDYITMTVLGMDASNTYEIRKYDFIPEKPTSTYPDKAYIYDLPRILLHSGLHGDGDTGDSNVMVVGLYWFMKDICENYLTDSKLAYLRHNIRITVVPLMNPWGFENRNRRNSNGVDLNRNAPFGWYQTEEGTASYSGTAPLSEAESRILKVHYDSLKDDCICHIEYHSRTDDFAINGYKMMYFTATQPWKLGCLARSIISSVTDHWRTQHGDKLNNDTYYLGYVNGPRPINQSGEQIGYANRLYPSYILEGFAKINSETTGDYRPFGPAIMSMIMDEIGNSVLYTLRYFKDGNA